MERSMYFLKMVVGLFRQETLDIYYIDCRVLLFRFLECFIEWTKRTF